MSLLLVATPGSNFSHGGILSHPPIRPHRCCPSQSAPCRPRPGLRPPSPSTPLGNLPGSPAARGPPPHTDPLTCGRLGSPSHTPYIHYIKGVQMIRKMKFLEMHFLQRPQKQSSIKANFVAHDNTLGELSRGKLRGGVPPPKSPS